MIKNLNDILTLFVLICLFVFSIRILIWAFIPKEKEDVINKDSKLNLFFEYNDNEEE